MYGRGNNNGDSDHNCSDDDAQRGILVLFDLFVNMKELAQNSICDGKKHQPDKDEYQSSYYYFQQLIEFDDERKGARVNKIYQHLFSSTKAGVNERHSQPGSAAGISKLPAKPGTGGIKQYHAQTEN